MFGFGVKKNIKIIDSSVLVDGRILGIIESGFIEGDLRVPPFVILELQHLADSQTHEKRQKGKRALELLERLQKTGSVNVSDDEFDVVEKVKEVDTKLVLLCKELGAKLLTVDFNLNKIAKIHGVSVLNINELFSAIRPIVLPGDRFTIKIFRAGAMPDQGVGSLEDGTMVVVDGALKFRGQKVEVVCRQFNSNPSGRMVFAEIDESGASDEAAR
jgi:uncharacterized protein YacL